MRPVHEPPGADPHAGWCGEGRLEAGPYPISEVERPISEVERPISEVERRVSEVERRVSEPLIDNGSKKTHEKRHTHYRC